jgi:E3 ubiquitin-protein ligase MUL1
MENFFEETAFIIHAGLTGILLIAYKECKNIFNNLHNIQTFEVGSKLKSALDASPAGSLEYAAISGKVEPIAEPLICSQGNQAVIKFLFSVGHFRNKLFSATWGASENLLYSTSSFVPFGLRSPGGLLSRSSLAIIDDPTTADLTNVLTTVGSKFVESEKVSVLGYLMNILSGKQKLGTETTEKILPVGSVLTAIGKVTRLPDGTTHISHPHHPSGHLPFILTTMSIDDIKASYKVQLRSFGFAVLLVGSIAGFFAMRVLCKWVFCLCVKKIRRDIVKKRNPDGIAGLHDSQICITCLSNPREVLFVPCGHICTCVDCWAKLKDYRCPVCRDYIIYGYPAFIP